MRLADLVVQLDRDPLPLCLLRRERLPSALSPLRLQPLEHLVERTHEVVHLWRAARGRAVAGPEEIDVLHPLGQLFDRLEHGPQQRVVRHEQEQNPAPSTTSSST